MRSYALMKFKYRKKICFDIDNTICWTQKNNYIKSKPNKNALKKINELYDNGYYIIIFTSRFMGRNNEKVHLAKKNGYQFTKKQLLNWNLKFHKLIFGKPSYDLIVDDKSIFFSKNWTKKIDTYL